MPQLTPRQFSNRRQPSADLTSWITRIEQRRGHPFDGLPIEPALRRLAATLLGTARQILPGQLVVLPLEAVPGDQIGHVIVVTEGQIETADGLHSVRMQVVFESPFLRQIGPALAALVDDLHCLLPSLGRRWYLAVEQVELGQSERRHPSSPAQEVTPADRHHDQHAGALQLAQVRQRRVGGMQDATDAAEKRRVMLALDNDEQLDGRIDPAAEAIYREGREVGFVGGLRNGWNSYGLLRHDGRVGILLPAPKPPRRLIGDGAA